MRKIGRLQTSFRSQAISVLRPSWLACAVGADGSVDESVEIDSNSASIRWHPHWRSWRLCWRGMWRHAAAAAATCYFTTWPMMWRRNVPLSSAALTRRRQVVRHNFVIIIALFLSSVVSRTVHTHTHTHTHHTSLFSSVISPHASSQLTRHIFTLGSFQFSHHASRDSARFEAAYDNSHGLHSG